MQLQRGNMDGDIQTGQQGGEENTTKPMEGEELLTNTFVELSFNLHDESWPIAASILARQEFKPALNFLGTVTDSVEGKIRLNVSVPFVFESNLNRRMIILTSHSAVARDVVSYYGIQSGNGEEERTYWFGSLKAGKYTCADPKLRSDLQIFRDLVTRTEA